jgi:hypothetical protein
MTDTPTTEAATPTPQPAASTPEPTSTGPATPSAEPTTPDGIPEGTEVGETAPDFGLQPLRSDRNSTGRSKKAQTPQIDPASWDGDLAKLPADVRSFVELLADKKYRAIEAEFASKRDELSRAQRDDAQSKPGADVRVTELEKELELYKLLAEGAEDPRVNELTGKLSEWETKYKALNTQFTTMRDAADQRWLSDYKAKHSEIFADKTKTDQLLGFVEQGWDEEAAAQLVGSSSELVRMATDLVRQHKLGYDGHVFAIQHAKMKLGLTTAPRAPRPAAELTSGAHGQRNPSRVQGGSLRELPRHEARAEAARLALAVDNRRKS